MAPIQPVGWWYYLTNQTTFPPVNLAHFFYLSWEDALWDLLKYFGCQAGSIILVPDFYCDDVVKNMSAHGLIVKTYPVDRGFQTSVKIFKQYLKKYQPDLVVIFHAVGITNKLLNKAEKWLDVLPKNSLLIEDSVHRVIDSNKISLITERHVIIDSLRKVVPLQGSNLYGPKSLLSALKPTPINQTLIYRLKVLWWWILFQCCLLMVLVLPFQKWQQWWNKLTELTMLVGYDHIGDSQLAGSGFNFFKNLSFKINHQHIFVTKVNQVELYQKLLEPLWQSKQFFRINFAQRDYGKLRAFPVGLFLDDAVEILNKLRSNGLMVRFELDNFGWTKRQKVIYLPLGPHLKEKDIFKISQIFLTVVFNKKF
ncbi:MAG: hypothetical protein ACOZAK_02850 [Patescibacteria group bacterium]